MHPPGDSGFEVLQRRAAKWDAPLVSVPDRGPWDWRVVTDLVKICRRERVAIWHGHDYKSNTLGLIVRRFWPMRLVTTVHGWVHRTYRTPLYYALDRLTLRRYERVLCVSGDLYDAALACGVHRNRCLLVENAIATDEFRRRADIGQAKARLGACAGTLVIGAVGRLSPEKGFDTLIRVADSLLTDGTDLELWIIGEGSERSRLQGLIDGLGRGDRIKLLGYRADTISLYEAMDIFVLSSLREGLPNVVLEAMAMNVPVVATRVAGVPRLLVHDQDGLLLRPGDRAGMKDAIARLAGDPKLRCRLSELARSKVESNYSFERRIDRLRDIYDELFERDEADKPC
jgi:glycosyltransferase involved in cell wall biosynthesis